MKRKELKAGTVLNSKYYVDPVKGVGANAIVYSANYWDNDVEHDILIKELFPFDGNAERSETSDGLIWNSDGTDWERIKKQAIDTYRYTQEIYRKTGFASAPVTYECFEENNTLYYAVIPNIGAEECSKHTFNSLIEITKTIRQLCYAVKGLHKEGYLHLDIKPDNFLVYNSPIEHIILIDNDTLTTKENLQKSGIITCSEGWTSPEQKQGYIEFIDERSDIYSIGAVLFRLVMGRNVSFMDNSVFADWKNELATNRYFVDKNPLLARKVNELFKRTLSANPSNRFDSVDDFIGVLDEIIKADKNPYFKQLNLCLIGGYFIGRENCLGEINSSFCNGCKNVLLYGDSGMGKSEIAKKYIDVHKNEYDSIILLRYNADTDKKISDCFEKSEINFFNYSDDEFVYNKIKTIIAENKNYKVLMVLDNYNVSDSDDFRSFLSIDADKIITTKRYDCAESYFDSNDVKTLEVNSLDNAFDVFRHYYEQRKSKIEEDKTEKLKEMLRICTYTTMNTYLCELLGRYGARCCNSAEEVLKEDICKMNESLKISEDASNEVIVSEVIKCMFKTYGLSDEDKKILGFMYYLNEMVVTDKILDSIFSYDCSENKKLWSALNKMIDAGFVKILRDESGESVRYSAHPLSVGVIMSLLNPNMKKCYALSRFYYFECSTDSPFRRILKKSKKIEKIETDRIMFFLRSVIKKNNHADLRFIRQCLIGLWRTNKLSCSKTYNDLVLKGRVESNKKILKYIISFLFCIDILLLYSLFITHKYNIKVIGYTGVADRLSILMSFIIILYYLVIYTTQEGNSVYLLKDRVKKIKSNIKHFSVAINKITTEFNVDNKRIKELYHGRPIKERIKLFFDSLTGADIEKEFYKQLEGKSPEDIEKIYEKSHLNRLPIPKDDSAPKNIKH